MINSTISGSEYWHTNLNGQRSNGNHTETYNEIIEPDTILLNNQNGGNTKIIRKIKRTFKTVKQKNDQTSNGEINNEWKENIVEPSITLDHNSPIFTTTSSPIVQLQRSSTTNRYMQSTASDLDNLITSKNGMVKWDDDNETILPLSRSPIFKTKIGNQESIFEKYASIMPLPPPNTQTTNQPTTQSSSTVDNQQQFSNENVNNRQSSSHHSVVAPLSSSNNNFFNFNSKIVHNQPVATTRKSESNNKNQRKKQTRNANKRKIIKQLTTQSTPIQDFFLEADKIDEKLDDRHVNNLKKTVDFTSRVNHEVSPKNNILAHLLKNNPFAIPLSKKTYKVTKKTTTPTPILSTVLSKRTQSIKYSNDLTSSSIGSSISRSGDEYITTTPMSTLSNDNLDNINFKATPSKQEYTWGRRVGASNNLISKTNPKANQLAKRNEWSGNDEQKDSLNDKLIEHSESDEESIENDENLPSNEDVEPINDVNDEFNKNLVAIRNEESPKFDVVTFKTPSNNNNQINQAKGSLNVKSLPIQIISWRQAISHSNRNKVKETVDDRTSPKPFAGERITSAKLIVSSKVRKEQQQLIEREKPSPKPFSNAKTQSAKQQLSSFRTTASPKQITTTKSAYSSQAIDSKLIDNKSTTQTTSKRQSSKSTRSPLNSFVAGRKNEGLI